MAPGLRTFNIINHTLFYVYKSPNQTSAQINVQSAWCLQTATLIVFLRNLWVHMRTLYHTHFITRESESESESDMYSASINEDYYARETYMHQTKTSRRSKKSFQVVLEQDIYLEILNCTIRLSTAKYTREHSHCLLWIQYSRAINVSDEQKVFCVTIVLNPYNATIIFQIYLGLVDLN